MSIIQSLTNYYRTQFRLLWSWRSSPRRLVARLILTLLVAGIALLVTEALLPGVTIDGWGSLLAAVIVLGLLNALVRPIFVGLVSGVSVVAVAIVSILFQVLVFIVISNVLPGVTVAGFWSAFWASWVFAIVNTILTSLISIDQDDSFYGTLVRQLATRQADAIRTDQPGVVIAQIDGLPHPVISRQIRAGRVPVMSRWVRSGSHRLDGWTAMLPSQTSASQAGILHGNNDGIPAFRWYEKKTNKLMVSNHPEDATELVRRISNGEGLLSNGGASINNLVSGDASRAYLTMATIKGSKQGLGDSKAFTAFFVSPYGYLHMTVQFFAEMIKEMIQARRQRRADIVPRMHRGGVYPVARAATNVALRALGTSLVMEEMYRGTPVIYIDYTDYDEIAHHSGPERSETLDALDGVDRQLGILERAALDAPRPYRFVVVSDHGQSLGATFLQRYGETLEDVVRSLMGGQASVEAATSRVEEWGPINTFLSEFQKSGGASAAVARSALGGRTHDGVVELGPSDAPTGSAGAKKAAKGEPAPIPDVVVVASGNLGLVSFTAMDERMTVEDVEATYPGLVDALANHPGIGLLMLHSAAHGAIAVGRDGINYLDEERVEGDDPVAQFGDHAKDSLIREDRMEHVPDILVISLLDEEFDEVAAFEELIGSHGGLGGMQTHPMLLHPTDWTIDEPIVGAPAVYRQLRRWIESTGHRLGTPPAAEVAPAVGPTATAPVTAEA